MSTPKLRVNRGNIGNELFIHLPNLDSFKKTFLSGDEASAQTILSVVSSSGFAENDYILIGNPAFERCELRKIASTAAGTVTVSAAITHAHSSGTLITFIPFNQIEIYSATAIGGSYSLATTIAIDPEMIETYHNVTADASTKAYKVRFKNETTTTYSDYSDEVVGSGYPYNSVYYIKHRALNDLGEKLNELVTDKDLTDWLNDCRRDFNNELKRWSFRQEFDYDMGNLSEGQYSIAVPTNLRGTKTPENILNLHIGGDGSPISYVDYNTWKKWYMDVGHTTVGTQPAIGAVTLVLSDSADFDSSGSVKIGDNTITYTANDTSTNTLSGIPATGDGSITATHAVGTDVWQNIGYGTPNEYTIFEDTLFFNCPIESEHDGKNLFISYYKTLTNIDSDADLLDEPDTDMFVSYLKYKIKARKKRGNIDIKTDPDYIEYVKRKLVQIGNEELHQGVKMVPDIGHLINTE